MWSAKKITNKVVITMSLAVLAIAGATLHNSPVSAATPPDNCFDFSSGTINNYYDNEDNNNANPACPRSVDIPSTIAGTPVTTIGTLAFGNRQLTAVTIPNTVTDIDDFAFRNNQLTSIVIPNSVTNMKTYAFADNLLTSVTIPNSLTVLNLSVFENNELTSVSIPNSITDVGYQAFNNNKLTSLVLPDSVTHIGDLAFSRNQLTSLTLSDYVDTIESYAFAYNQLTSLDLGNNISTIGSGAFAYNQLTDVIIPTSVSTIGANPFLAQGADAAELSVGNYSSLMDIYYTRLYTADPSNPANLQDAQQLYPESGLGIDVNNDGDQLDDISVGGHIVNPAQATVSYRNTTGATLAPTETITGTGLSNYMANDNDTNNLSRYFRLEQSRSFTAPTIAGYSIVTPSSPYSTTLTSTNTAINFVYSNPSNDNVPQAPATGVSRSSLLSISDFIVFALVAIGLIILVGNGGFAKRTR